MFEHLTTTRGSIYVFVQSVFLPSVFSSILEVLHNEKVKPEISLVHTALMYTQRISSPSNTETNYILLLCNQNVSIY